MGEVTRPRGRAFAFYVLGLLGWAGMFVNWFLFIGLLTARSPLQWVLVTAVGSGVGLVVATVAAWRFRYHNDVDLEGQDVTARDWFRQMSELPDMEDADAQPFPYRGRHRSED